MCVKQNGTEGGKGRERETEIERDRQRQEQAIDATTLD